MTEHPRGFASDNNSGAHPEILAAIAAANDGHVVAYGDDDYTAAARQRFREHFGEQAEAFIVFNGTGANVLAIQALARPHEAVICPATAHLNVDECGAPERIAGVKLLDGRDPRRQAHPRPGGGQDHRGRRPARLPAARRLGLAVHRARHRLHAGGDRRPGRPRPPAPDVPARRRRPTGQRRSGPRPAAPRADHRRRRGRPLIRRDEERPPARRRDRLPASRARARLPLHPQAVHAARLQDEVSGGAIRRPPGRRSLAPQRRARQRDGQAASPTPSRTLDRVELAYPVQANGVFATLPGEAIERLRDALPAAHPFYVWDEAAGTIRLMCSWDTTEDDVDGLASAIEAAV